MGKATVCVLIAVFMAGCLQEQDTLRTEVPEPARDGIFIHLTTGPDEPLRALQALQKGTRFSERADVALYADIEAVNIFLKDAEDLTHKDFASSHTMIKELVDKGVRIAVCPGCLKAAGKSADDLMKGIVLATPSGFFDFTEGCILSLDY